MKIHHIGYYVPSMEEAKNEFLGLGYVTEGDCIYDSERSIEVQFLRNGDNVIELVSPREGCMIFPKSMKKLGANPYHICYECANIEETVAEWISRGWLLVRSSSPAPAIANNLVAFLYSESIGMIEFVEIKGA